MVLILGIETSCDETAAAVVEDGYRVRSTVVATQTDLHAEFAGIVPELASRAHIEQVLPVVHQALRSAGVKLADLDAVAVTSQPGLVGSLLVGVSTAKALAWGAGKPLVAVNHVEGHLHANALERGSLPSPGVHLVVSGAHTTLFWSPEPDRYERAGRTVDDAAGEALDKVSILLGLGYPGGPALEKAARQGRADAVPLPRGLARSREHDFSFSGLKTAVRNHLRRNPETPVADVAASVQEAVVDILARKAFRLADQRGARVVALTGGVAANQRLRERFAREASQRDLACLLPEPRFCTDNAAMIAGRAAYHLARGEEAGLDLDADPRR